MQVDPRNRLVADALEAAWNDRLRALTEAQESYERQSQADRATLDEHRRSQVLALASDFPRLWRDPNTPDRERKRMVRLLIEDVTLLKGESITAHIRFKGGATRSLTLPIPLPAWATWQSDPELVTRIDRLLDQYTDGQIAALLNEQGCVSGKGHPFTRNLVIMIFPRENWALSSSRWSVSTAPPSLRNCWLVQVGHSAVPPRMLQRALICGLPATLHRSRTFPGCWPSQPSSPPKYPSREKEGNVSRSKC